MVCNAVSTFEALYPKTTFYSKAIKSKEGGKNTIGFHTLMANIHSYTVEPAIPLRNLKWLYWITRKVNSKAFRLPDHHNHYSYQTQEMDC